MANRDGDTGRVVKAEGGAPRRAGRLCRLVLLGALAGLAAPLLTPLWLGFDVFSQFTIHFAILAAACGAGLIARKGLGLAIPAAIGGVLALSFWANMHGSPGFDAPPPAGQIRVMTFNTWQRNHDVAAIAREIRREKPDVVGMMEFGPSKRKLMRLLSKEYPYHGDCISSSHCYLGFLSRWPIEKVSGRSMWAGPPYLHAIVRAPSGPLHVYVVHTLRFPWLGSQLNQIKALAHLVGKVKGPVIVMGDFNTTPFSVMMRTFIKRTKLTRRTFVPSWPAWAGPLPQLAIDHIFASPDLRTVSGPFIGRNAGSDHFPVILTLERK